jgi:hypothetical protein
MAQEKVKFYFILLSSSLLEVMKVGLSPPPMNTIVDIFNNELIYNNKIKIIIVY